MLVEDYLRPAAVKAGVLSSRRDEGEGQWTMTHGDSAFNRGRKYQSHSDSVQVIIASMSPVADNPVVVSDRELVEEKSHEPSGPRIRCPLCCWSPRKEDKWSAPIFTC